jgi:hypothetical protein
LVEQAFRNARNYDFFRASDFSSRFHGRCSLPFSFAMICVHSCCQEQEDSSCTCKSDLWTFLGAYKAVKPVLLVTNVSASCPVSSSTATSPSSQTSKASAVAKSSAFIVHALRTSGGQSCSVNGSGTSSPMWAVQLMSMTVQDFPSQRHVATHDVPTHVACCMHVTHAFGYMDQQPHDHSQVLPVCIGRPTMKLHVLGNSQECIWEHQQ